MISTYNTNMKTISIDEYRMAMGPLISLEDESDFVSIKGSINLKLSKILDNPSKYLDKTKTYYFYCYNGTRSTRAVRILSVYGYKAVKVIK